MKLKILIASVLIGALVTAWPAYEAGFTPDSIREWVLNGLFVTAVASFLGMKLIVKDPMRMPKDIDKKKSKRFPT